MDTVTQTVSLTGTALLGMYSLYTVNIPALLVIILGTVYALSRRDS